MRKRVTGHSGASVLAQGQQHSEIQDEGMSIPREDSLRCSVCVAQGATSALRFPIAYSSPDAKNTEGNGNQIRNQRTHSGLESECEEFIFPSSKQRKSYCLPIPFSPRYPGLIRLKSVRDFVGHCLSFLRREIFFSCRMPNFSTWVLNAKAREYLFI